MVTRTFATVRARADRRPDTAPQSQSQGATRTLLVLNKPMSTSVPTEIRSARQRLGLSQARLAELSGVSESSVKRLEDPDRLPRRSRVLRDVRAAIADLDADLIPNA